MRRGPAAVAELSQLVAASDAALIIARYPSDQLWVPAAVAASGRVVLPAGTLVFWEVQVGQALVPLPVPGVDVVRAQDIPADEAARLVADLVEKTFDGYSSHYAVDPLIDPADALAGYVEWAQSCLGSADHCVLVLRVDGVAAGLATCAFDERGAEILLAGVLPDYRRRGLYPSLLGAVVSAVVARGGSRVAISTQAHNATVQRAWARFGFTPVDAVETVHLLQPDLL